MITRLCTSVPGTGTVLFGLILAHSALLELPRIAPHAEASSRSMARAAVPLAEPAVLNPPALSAELAQAGLTLGAPIYLRIFKSNGQDGASRLIAGVQGAWEEKWIPNLKRAWVELWIQGQDGHYQLFKRYPVCTYTGHLGPKLAEADQQAPEGFYAIESQGMNPQSAYYRSMDIGYPNAYDRLRRATGSHIKIHGMCISGGCFTMGEPHSEDHRYIEELYTFVRAVHARGQAQVPVHIFPFPMTEENMAQFLDSRWRDFWTRLKPAYDFFEQDRLPPQVHVIDGEYVIAPGIRPGLSTARCTASVQSSC